MCRIYEIYKNFITFQLWKSLAIRAVEIWWFQLTQMQLVQIDSLTVQVLKLSCGKYSGITYLFVTINSRF